MRFPVLFLLSTLSFVTSASQNRKVLLIGIDGCRSDALQQAHTPNIDALLSTSLYSFDSWHVGITWSGPSWTTILTGAEWNKHGVTDNTFSGKNFNDFPAFPARAKEIHPNLKCVEVVEWDPLADEFSNGGWDKIVQAADGSTFPTADSAVLQLQDPDIDLLFTYFDQVDLTGHTTTFSPLNALYINAIQNVDSAIGIVLDALHDRPTYANEDWLILLITDHGGNSFFHGGNSFEERHIWWIASGNAVQHRQVNENDPGTYNCNLNDVFDTTCVDAWLLKQSPVHADIAVTALHHLVTDAGVDPETKAEWNLDGKSWLTSPTGMQPSASTMFNVYPNPATSGISVNLEQSGAAKITLSDMHGKTVMSENVYGSEVTLPLENISAGWYLLHVITADQSILRKIMVTK